MNTWVHPWFLVGSLLLIFLVFCVVFWSLCVFILCFVYPIMAMLPVSLDCPFLIAPSNVYLYIAVVSYFVGGVHHYKLIILFCDKKTQIPTQNYLKLMSSKCSSFLLTINFLSWWACFSRRSSFLWVQTAQLLIG